MRRSKLQIKPVLIAFGAGMIVSALWFTTAALHPWLALWLAVLGVIAVAAACFAYVTVKKNPEAFQAEEQSN